MNIACFDHLSRTISTMLSRRALAGTLGFGALNLPSLVEAKKKRKRKKKRKKKIALNDFGCVNVGDFCKTSEQCCSGICEGKKDKKTCQAHDTGGCQTEQDYCVEELGSACPEAPTAHCYRTTGNASVCGLGTASACMACAHDAECEAVFGPGAACVVCTACLEETDTACVPGIP